MSTRDFVAMAHSILEFVFAARDAGDDRLASTGRRRDASNDVPLGEETRIDAVDAVCLANLRAGSESAFAELYHDYFESLWAFAYRYVRQRAVAEEIVQDVFFWVWSARQKVQVRSTVRSYLFAAVRNRALTLLARERGRTVVSDASALTTDELLGVSPTMIEPAPSPHERAESADVERAIVRAVSALPERQQLAMTLRLTHGMTYAEIASVLDVSEAAVGKLILKAQDRLRQALEPFRP